MVGDRYHCRYEVRTLCVFTGEIFLVVGNDMQFDRWEGFGGTRPWIMHIHCYELEWYTSIINLLFLFMDTNQFKHAYESHRPRKIDIWAWSFIPHMNLKHVLFLNTQVQYIHINVCTLLYVLSIHLTIAVHRGSLFHVGRPPRSCN